MQSQDYFQGCIQNIQNLINETLTYIGNSTCDPNCFIFPFHLNTFHVSSQEITQLRQNIVHNETAFYICTSLSQDQHEE